MPYATKEKKNENARKNRALRRLTEEWRIAAREYDHARYIKRREKYGRAVTSRNTPKTRAATAKYDRMHPEKRRARRSKRRAAMKNAVPQWLTKDQHAAIAAIYALCPRGFHVDHIVPICGETVCGLHVPWNLQILAADMNIRKGNKL